MGFGLLLHRGGSMKKTLFIILSFIVLVPLVSLAEDEGVLREIRIRTEEQLKPGDALFLFSSELAELQAISEAVRYISYAQTSDEEYRKLVEEHIRQAMKKLYEMMETHTNSPIVIRGFSIDFPFEITVEFEILPPE
jgi:hypothetical protein